MQKPRQFSMVLGLVKNKKILQKVTYSADSIFKMFSQREKYY